MNVDCAFVTAVFTYVYVCTVVLSSPYLEIKLECTKSCRSIIILDWLVFGLSSHHGMALGNCSARYSPSLINAETEIKVTIGPHKSGTFALYDLQTGEDYTIQIDCGRITSQPVKCAVEDVDCPPSTSSSAMTTDSPVVRFEDQTWNFGSRDSVLGIVFGLFGLTIIAVTSFYLLKRYRRQRRLERIRRHLRPGESLIDPFDNLRNRDQDMDNGEVMLLGSSDSLT